MFYCKRMHATGFAYVRLTDKALTFHPPCTWVFPPAFSSPFFHPLFSPLFHPSFHPFFTPFITFCALIPVKIYYLKIMI